MVERFVITGGSGFIGRNLIEALSKTEADLYNLDIRVDHGRVGNSHTIQCDLMDKLQLKSIMQEIQPTAVVHLAARTDPDGVDLDDYAVNTVGTENLIEAMRGCASLKRAIFTSTQFVVGPGPLPADDEDLRPHTVYGESKAIAERIIRKAGLTCTWTIVRPTNVWGPWHPRYPTEFWRVVKQGRYLHPGRQPVVRSYAYVGNVVFQLLKILDADPSLVHRRTIYVGDPPIDLYQWTSAFSRALLGREPRIVPRPLVKTLALVGDVVVGCGGRFPLTTSRYRSMTIDYPTPMAPTIDLLGRPPYRLEDGVAETVQWLRSRGKFWL